MLAAIAAQTERIRLSSAVTVLSSDDPVRVYESFATLDLLSGGRAEIMAGRGSFIESFPLFGYDLDDYDDLFAEKLELLLEIRARDAAASLGGLSARSRASTVLKVGFMVCKPSRPPRFARRYVPRRGMETGGRVTEGTLTCSGGRSTLTLGSATGGLTGSAGDVGGVGASLTGGTVEVGMGPTSTGGTGEGGVGAGELAVGGGAVGETATGSRVTVLAPPAGVFGALAVGALDTGVPGLLRTGPWLGR